MSYPINLRKQCIIRHEKDPETDQSHRYIVSVSLFQRKRYANAFVIYWMQYMTRMAIGENKGCKRLAKDRYSKGCFQSGN